MENLVLVERSAMHRPEWVELPPPEENDRLYFVGYSRYQATDQEAREEALMVARRRFAEFAGVEVSLLDEVVHTAEGKGSEVLDTNVSALSRVSQSATATVSRLRIQQWYWERYRSSKGWNNQKSVFRCWVLVAAPKEELHRIQARQEMRSAAFNQAEPPEIQLQIKVGQDEGKVLREGENIPLSVSSDHDCYLLLIYQDSAGNLVQLLPNRRSPEAFFSAGKAFRVPGINDDFAFTVTEPFGKEAFWAFASSHPTPSLKGIYQQDGTILLHNNIDLVLNRLRVHGKLPGVAYGEARTMLTTAP